METVSVHTTNLDPYRAGIDIARECKKIQPEVIFLFPTIHYNGSPELPEAIYDVLDNEKLIIIGCTGDGFYEKDKMADIGVSALAINTNGKTKWHLATETGIEDNAFSASKKCVNDAKNLCSNQGASLYIVFNDFRTDNNQIIKALQETVNAPLVGGIAGDDLKLAQCFIYSNKEVLTDSIAVLAIEGEISFAIKTAQNFNPIGKKGTITKCSGNSIETIDDQSAMSFIADGIGKDLHEVDRGLVTLKIIEVHDNREFSLRSLGLFENEKNGTVDLFCGTNQGDQVQVCLADEEKLLNEVNEIGASINDLDFDVKAALLISCAGRKQVLSTRINQEVRAISENCTNPISIAGFPSYGELGSVKVGTSYSQPYFHNMTLFVLLIG